jgi:hypothetical protein
MPRRPHRLPATRGTLLTLALHLALAAARGSACGVDILAAPGDSPQPAGDRPQAAGGSLWAEAEAGHDSDPTAGSPHALAKSHGAPDSFVEYQAAGRCSLPLAPWLALVLKERADDREYQGDKPEDSGLVHSEVQLPLALGRAADLVPYGYVEDQWYGHDYYSTVQRAALRWTEHWTHDWDSDLIPYVERDRYRPPNRFQDATIDGCDAALTWWVPGRCWLAALTAGVGGALANARVDYAAYKQDDANLDQRWELPGRIRADLDLDWSPTLYEAFAPGTRKLRQDRTFTGDLQLSRPLLRWLLVVGELTLTSVRSNVPIDQYHELVMSAGIRVTTY